jgi:hypothetical protein
MLQQIEKLFLPFFIVIRFPQQPHPAIHEAPWNKQRCQGTNNGVRNRKQRFLTLLTRARRFKNRLAQRTEPRETGKHLRICLPD